MILPPCFRIDAGLDVPRIKCDKPQAEISSVARTDSRGRLSPRFDDFV
jgi:hypothetical protein